jgi:hypothetical protein
MRIWSQIFGFAAEAFRIIQTPFGTSPTADTPTDTLTLTSAQNTITITGDASTDTINFEDGPSAEIDNGNSGSADTINWTAGPYQRSTLTANCTYTFTAPSTPRILILRVIQDSTPRSITWPASVLWPGNIDPVISEGSGDADVFTFYWNGTSYFSLGIQFNVS